MTRRIRVASALCFSVSLLVIWAGCSREAKLYPVSGTVTFEDQPLSEGDIMFVSLDGVRGPDPGKIKDGRYELKTTAGKKRVEISASKIRPGGARGAGGEPVAEEYVPPRYNTESQLTAEVQTSGQNAFNFVLKAR